MVCGLFLRSSTYILCTNNKLFPLIKPNIRHTPPPYKTFIALPTQAVPPNIAATPANTITAPYSDPYAPPAPCHRPARSNCSLIGPLTSDAMPLPEHMSEMTMPVSMPRPRSALWAAAAMDFAKPDQQAA